MQTNWKNKWNRPLQNGTRQRKKKKFTTKDLTHQSETAGPSTSPEIRKSTRSCFFDESGDNDEAQFTVDEDVCAV